MRVPKVWSNGKPIQVPQPDIAAELAAINKDLLVHVQQVGREMGLQEGALKLAAAKAIIEELLVCVEAPARVSPYWRQVRAEVRAFLKGGQDDDRR